MYSICMKLDPTPGYLVWRLSMKWRAAVDRAVGPLGLTHAQYSLLASLHGMARAGQRPSQRELADHTGLEPIFVSKLVRALEGSGLLLREPHPDDSRAVRLSLTEHGSDVAVRAIAVVQELHQELTAPLGGPTSARTGALVDALHALLGTDDRSAPMTQTPLLTGQDIGTAAYATRAVLDRLLDRHRLGFPQWVSLRVVATRGPALPRPEFEQILTDGQALPPELVPTLAAQLLDAGLAVADDSGRLDPSPQGRALHDEITAEIAGITEQLYGSLDPADLAATRRILDQVTVRARELSDGL
ncbi:hypothetical protein GCM10010193_01930 [Kitasatospora atroaurantiaca]|uniref:DNA-binding MarR family transcriptional regulator n=1 Tax=Kitasatospora atroaurantiaca TaxID=285545 RepID=A0A561ELC1_9ACTN|nr:DNA-binding MarR family transcriptional regulator [Kitasatospora atroaurantiaca]